MWRIVLVLVCGPMAIAVGAATQPAVIADAQLHEASGVAQSQRDPELYWLHNDSGDGPRVFAIDATGRARARLTLTGAQARDWEDMASFTLAGEAYLLLGDVGDNRGERNDCRLYAVAEPELAGPAESLQEIADEPAWTVPLHLPEGPADIEAVAVDGESVLLLTKRLGRNRLYVLPLRPKGAAPPARLLGELAPAGPRVSGDWKKLGEDLAPTAMDVRGDLLAISTYHSVWLIDRDADGGWLGELGRMRQLAAPTAPQIESCCFVGPRSLLLVSEGRHPRLLHMDLESHGQSPAP